VLDDIQGATDRGDEAAVGLKGRQAAARRVELLAQQARAVVLDLLDQAVDAMPRGHSDQQVRAIRRGLRLDDRRFPPAHPRG
jgi:hypothetical protein